MSASASATMASVVFTVGNTQAITLIGLYDVISGTFMDAASVQATLYDQAGNPVPGCIGVVLAYEAGSNGNYQGVFGDNTFTPPVGSGYSLVVTGNQSGGFIRIVKTAQVEDRMS